MRTLEAPAFSNRAPAEPGSGSKMYGWLDTLASNVAIGAGLLFTFLYFALAFQAGVALESYLWAALPLGLAAIGRLNLYLSELWERPDARPWRLAIVVILKPVCVLILFPVVFILLPLLVLYLVAVLHGWIKWDTL